MSESFPIKDLEIIQLIMDKMRSNSKSKDEKIIDLWPFVETKTSDRIDYEH